MTATHQWPLDRSDHLTAALREQGASPDEIADLTPALMQLAAWVAPTPTVADTERLMAQLVSQGAIDAPLPVRASIAKHGRARQGWAVLWRQPRFIHRSVWLAAAIAIMLAAVNMLMRGEYDSSSLGIFLPAIAAVSVAFLYGPEVDPCLEITLTTPISPRLMLFSRLALLLGFEVALGLVATTVVALSHGQGIGALVTLWLGPTALLTATSVALSLVLGPIIAAGTTVVVWFAQFIKLGSGIALSQTVSPFWHNSPLLFMLAAIFLLFTLFYVSRCERIAPKY